MQWFKALRYRLKSGWWWAAPYSNRDVERQARVDGSLDKPVPQLDDITGPWYLGAMKEHFDNIVRGIVGAYQELDAPLENRQVALEAGQREADREEQEASTVYEEACAHFKQHNPGIPPDTQRARTTLYWLICLVLFILEFPMNFAAFQIFGDNANLLTSITVFMVAGILVGSAHFMGVEWRRGPFSNRQSLSVFVTTLAMPVLAILGVATLRSLHFSRETDSEVAKMPVSLLFLSFAIFNLGIYLVGALLSRWVHPVGAEEVLHSRKRLVAARRSAANVKKELEMVRNNREVLQAQHATEAHRVTDQHLELVKRYLMENLRVRRGDGLGGAAIPQFLLKAPPETDLNLSLKVSLPPLIARRIAAAPAADMTKVGPGSAGPGEPARAAVAAGQE